MGRANPTAACKTPVHHLSSPPSRTQVVGAEAPKRAPKHPVPGHALLPGWLQGGNVSAAASLGTPSTTAQVRRVQCVCGGGGGLDGMVGGLGALE